MSVPSPTVVDEIHHARVKACYPIPLYTCPVSAGFPSPADEYLEGKLDLNQYLVPHPLATFYALAKKLSNLRQRELNNNG